MRATTARIRLGLGAALAAACTALAATVPLPAATAGATEVGTGVPADLVLSPCGADPARPEGGTWTCTFADDFDGTTLDRTKWAPMTSAATGTGFPECRVDDPDNIAVRGGSLRLTVRQEPMPFLCRGLGTAWTTIYTAGAVTTYDHHAQGYGRIEIRAKFPGTRVRGLHSALWLWPHDTTYADGSGELDIAEYRTLSPDLVVPTLHYRPASDGQPTSSYRCTVPSVGEWHTYVLEFDAERIAIGYDGRTCLVNVGWKAVGLPRPEPFGQRFAINLNQSLGVMANAITPGLTPLPATMEVDYVRAWS